MAKATYKRLEGATWVEYYFKTSADLIDETATYKVLLATERTKITDFLTTFQTATTNNSSVANKLVQVNADGKIVAAQIQGGLLYLPIANPSFTGTMLGNTIGSNNTFALTLTNGSANQSKIELLDNGGISITSVQPVKFFGAATTIDVNSKSIINVPAPTAVHHAVNKQYLDDAISFGIKWATNGPVKAASTANVVLTGTAPNFTGPSGATVDGFTISAGVATRILLRAQSTGAQNGIYEVTGTTWLRDTTDNIYGTLVFIENGSSYNDWTFQSTSSTGSSWIQTSTPDTVLAGSGLTKTGTTLSISSGAITDAMLAGSISTSKILNHTPIQTQALGTVGDPVSDAFTTHISRLYTAIKGLRGTDHWNSTFSDTISSNKSLAVAKNRTYAGTADTPSGGTYIEGDLYFKIIV